MANICTKITIIPKNPVYYFQNKLFDSDKQIKLEPRLLNLKDSLACQIKLIIFTNDDNTAFKEGGKTEESKTDEKTGTISFKKFFVMEYLFEKVQPIEFVITGDIEAKIQTNLPSIMGSRNNTLKKEIKGYNDVVLEIKGFPFENKKGNILKFNISMEGDFERKGLGYEIIAKHDENKDQPLYTSEGIYGIKSDKRIEFKSCSFQDIFITNNKKYEETQICISFIDFMHNKQLGDYSGFLSPLTEAKTYVPLNEEIYAIINIEKIKNYSFVDYLKGGMQINLTVAIDYTESNGVPTDSKSYHYLEDEKTIYEKAIKACGDIVGYYDSDQKFPAFGFGGKFYGDPNVSHCFPLNRNPDDPEIQGINGILKAYREVLNNTVLFGPTHFHYIIENLNERVRKEIQGDNFNNYNILMILTDGIIDDMDETINSLVESSFLPISVIIIGIGDTDFTNMETLDADKEPLYHRDGRKADRDLVQFVSFPKFQNDAKKLAEQVLEEIPRQVVEFYQHKKLQPGELIKKK